MENEKVEQVKRETAKMEKMREHPSRLEVIGSFIGMDMVGSCFGIGLILAVKTVNNLECSEINALKVILFKLFHQRDEDQTIIHDNQNLEDKAF